MSVILFRPLTHWGRVTHICISKHTIIGSDNGLAPGRRQTIIWTNDGILLIGPSGTNFSEILIGIQTFSFKKMHLKMSSAKWRPFCLGSKCCDIWNFRRWANYTKNVSSLQTSVIKQLAILSAIYTAGELQTRYKRPIHFPWWFNLLICFTVFQHILHCAYLISREN